MESLRTAALEKAKQTTPEDVVNLFLHNSSLQKGDDLQELLRSMSEKQQTELWNGLSSHVINAIIQETAGSEDHADDETGGDKISLEVLKIAVKLALLSISVQECVVPQPLFQSVLLLHGYVMSSDHKGLKEPVVKLCETWWLNNIEGREGLAPAPLMYLMEKCLMKKPTARSVTRLWKMRDALTSIDLHKGKTIWDVVFNLLAHAPFVRANQGQKFLSSVMLAKPSLLKRMHQTLKYGLSQFPVSIAPVYADIVMTAWKKCDSAEVKALIETDIIQDMMYNAIHIKRGNSKSLHASLVQFMSRIHSMRSNIELNTMLVKMYQPFLWRSLRAANADVRANAAELLLDALPLVDGSKHKQHCEESLQKQFDLLSELLEDGDQVVRQVAVAGVCQALYKYASEIPQEVSSYLMNILFAKSAWDQSSVDVRVAVIEGISVMLDEHTNYTLIGTQLHTLTDLLHDKSEKVRIAFIKLLIKIKHIRAFKVWKIISKEHVFARLEVDSAAVCVKLVELTYKSFISDSIDIHVQLERCIELIESGLERARRFYRYAVVHVNLQQAVNYMLLLRKCIMTCVSKNKNSVKENRRPSLCTTLANMTVANQTVADVTTFNNFTMINNNITQYVQDKDGSQEEDDEELSVDSTSVMRGLFDVICIMWTGFNKELNMSGNSEMKEIMCDKFSRSLIECFSIFKDEEIQQSLLYIASFLPSIGSSTLCRKMEQRLQDLPECDSNEAAACSSLVLCLCQWGRANKVLDTLYKWAAPLSTPNRPRRSSKDGEHTGASLRSLAQVIGCILSKPNCLSSIRKEESQLQQLIDRLGNVQLLVRRCLEESRSFGLDADVLVSLLTIHSKLLLILHQDEKLLSHMKELCSTVTKHCLEGLKSTDDDEILSQASGAKKPRRLLDLQETVLDSNDSVEAAVGTAGGAYVTQLSTKATQATLTIIVNYLLVHTLSSEALHTVSGVLQHCDILCSSGLSSALFELLQQLTKAAAISPQCNTLSCDDVLQECWTQIVKCCLSKMCDIEFLAGMRKSSWLNLLLCTDMLVTSVQRRVAAAMTMSMISLLEEEGITPTRSEQLRVTISSSKTLQHLIGEELKLKEDACTDDSTRDNIHTLIAMATPTHA